MDISNYVYNYGSLLSHCYNVALALFKISTQNVIFGRLILSQFYINFYVQEILLQTNAMSSISFSVKHRTRLVAEAR